MNRSSSLHDIAHGLAAEAGAAGSGGNGGGPAFNPMSNVMVSNDGVSWEDQRPAWHATQSAVHHPAMNGLLGARPSVNSAQFKMQQQQQQQQPGFWNPMWSAAGGSAFDPMLNPFHNPMMTSMHRSMHDLHSAVGGPTSAAAAAFMMQQQQQQGSASVHGGGGRHHGAQQQFGQHHLRTSSPSNASQKSSSNKRGNKYSRKSRHRSGSSRPHSRSASSVRASRGRRLASTDDEENDGGDSEEEDEEDEEDEDEDENFYTGESDAGGGGDFVSLSSGSNSRVKAPAATMPKKPWTCDHCTFVNPPGGNVCAMCCKTSRQSRGDAAVVSPPPPKMPPSLRLMSSPPAAKGKITRSKSSGRSASKPNINRSSRYSSDEDDALSDFGSKKRSASMRRAEGDSRGGRFQQHKSRNSNRLSAAKSLSHLDHVGQQSDEDLEQDVMNAYYAVRMGERRRSAAFSGRGHDGKKVYSIRR